MHDAEETYDLAPPETPRAAERPHTRRAYAEHGAVLTCPGCGYDLRGSRLDRCPECGLELTRAVLRRQEVKRERKTDAYLEPILYLAGGMVVAAGVTLLVDGPSALAALAIYFGITIAIGWIVFFALSVMWIGFDQPIPATVFLLAAAYAGSFGINVGLGAIWVPLGWLAGIVSLILLLAHLLDIELIEAIAVASLSFAIKYVGIAAYASL